MLGHDHLYPNPGALVTFLGLHDVGRFMNEPGATVEGLKLAWTFLMTARGTPLVYYGDEIAMRGGNDPDNRRDFPGGFPGDARSAFEAGGRTPEEEAVFRHLQRLARLRAQLEPLRRGATVHRFAGEQAYAFTRETRRDAVLVILNNGTGPQTVEFGAPERWSEGAVLEDRLTGAPEVRVERGRIRVAPPAHTGAVYVLKAAP